MSWESIDPSKPNDTELIGDEPFDIISEALDKVVACYQKDLGRKPATVELVKTFEHVLAPRFFETVLDGGTTELVSVSFKVKKIPKRQKYQAGDFVKAQLADGREVFGRVFEVGPFGPLVGVYDSAGLESPALEELRKRKLIVKVFPIHKELMEARSWLVFDHLPIDAFDDNQPRAPISISGFNEQLNAANCFYGLPYTNRHGLDEYLNR
ncbi:MAG TPA: hypothetical protein PKA41_12830 [Verrucomicrobiota bacterium]|nr:hypothetical protein [Verrucomicrobiota bacterium]